MSHIAVEVFRHSSTHPWSYQKLEERQTEIQNRILQGGEGALLLSELAPVITRGRRATPNDLLWSEEALQRQGVQVHTTDRGGLATYHGPGQWVLFPVDSLEVLVGDRRGVRRAVEGMLNICLEVGLQYDSSCHIRSGCELGVWTSQGKFAAVGIHIQQGVLLHGLAINGYQTATSFVGLRPCGLDAPVDFLLKNVPAVQRDQEFESLGERLVYQARQMFWKGGIESRVRSISKVSSL